MNPIYIISVSDTCAHTYTLNHSLQIYKIDSLSVDHSLYDFMKNICIFIHRAYILKHTTDISAYSPVPELTHNRAQPKVTADHLSNPLVMKWFWFFEHILCRSMKYASWKIKQEDHKNLSWSYYWNYITEISCGFYTMTDHLMQYLNVINWIFQCYIFCLV